MKVIFLIIGLFLTLGAMANTSLFYLGLIFMVMSFVFSTNKENSVAKLEKRRKLLGKLDDIATVPMSDKAVSNKINDAMGIVAKMGKGAKADLSAKSLVSGTFDVVEDVGTVLKSNK